MKLHFYKTGCKWNCLAKRPESFGSVASENILFGENQP